MVVHIRLRNERMSNGNRSINSTGHDGAENLPEVKQYGNYWTIVSNSIGEMSTAIDSNCERFSGLPIDEGHTIVHTQYEEDHLVMTDADNAIEVLDGYITPIHSHPVQLDMYIQPSQPRYEAEQSMCLDDDNVHIERDGYITPTHSRPEKHDECIKPIHSYPLQTDILYTSQSIDIELP
ncbi:hypothetical protein CHS0354_038636 [Potamilus streckersoni]|uniref:Uncharacterized protein n=1 Tax=Potamilus streckersoni TaxID=2493646 RepID=A0AAE0T8L5_9BIVA|nr:hypothetical protein CHS0354_038636 [Potamilus streckersoni]